MNTAVLYRSLAPSGGSGPASPTTITSHAAKRRRFEAALLASCRNPDGDVAPQVLDHKLRILHNQILIDRALKSLSASGTLFPRTAGPIDILDIDAFGGSNMRILCDLVLKQGVPVKTLYLNSPWNEDLRDHAVATARNEAQEGTKVVPLQNEVLFDESGHIPNYASSQTGRFFGAQAHLVFVIGLLDMERNGSFFCPKRELLDIAISAVLPGGHLVISVHEPSVPVDSSALGASNEDQVSVAIYNSLQVSPTSQAGLAAIISGKRTIQPHGAASINGNDESTLHMLVYKKL